MARFEMGITPEALVGFHCGSRRRLFIPAAALVGLDSCQFNYMRFDLAYHSQSGLSWLSN